MGTKLISSSLYVCCCFLVFVFFARLRACVALNTLPNIIMASQGYFPLSGLALPAGVDWEKIRAYSLDYKKSCKQSHIEAAGEETESWQLERDAWLLWLLDWLVCRSTQINAT